jgi:hypothetical protein
LAQSSSYLEFSLDEAVAGAVYAKGKYGLDLSAEFLCDLANRTRALMEREVRTFPDARFQVLNGARLFARTQKQKDLRDATKGALGKMFNTRKKFAKTNKSPKPMGSLNASVNEKGQFEFILS